MFTVEQRDALRERVLAMAKTDPRVVAGAAVGSLAVGEGDRFSDVDLTFAVGDDVPVHAVLDDWTRELGEAGAVALLDLAVGPTVYRVFLLPDALQLDLSLTPAARFAPAGPRFELLFGRTADAAQDDARGAPGAADLFGWGVVYALHARACIERGRVWQAEHYVGAVRDRALSLACLRHGRTAVQARGYDDLPADVLDALADAHVGSLDPEPLRAALAAATRALLREGEEAGVAEGVVAERLAELR